MATRRFKLRFSKVIPSFRFCRSRNASSVHVPVKYILSPYNQKSLDNSFPNFPHPPPSTPVTSSTNLFITKMSSAVGCGYDCSFESPEWWWNGVAGRQRNVCNGNGNVFGESDDGDVSSTSPPVAKKRFSGKRVAKGATFTAKSRLSSSSGDSGWSSSDEVTTLESSRAFSNSSSNYRDETRTLISTTTSKSVPSKKNRTAVKSLKRQPSKLKSDSKPTPSLSTTTGMKTKTAVMESLAVEKRSEDPYGDFKRSMMEMIQEKQMFETAELEELLRCFLSLNSRCHHRVIVEAFTEIWGALYAKSPVKNRRGIAVGEKRLT